MYPWHAYLHGISTWNLGLAFHIIGVIIGVEQHNYLSKSPRIDHVMQSHLDSQELSLVPDGRCSFEPEAVCIATDLDPIRNVMASRHLDVPTCFIRSLSLSLSLNPKPRTSPVLHLNPSVHARAVVQFTLPRELSFQPQP